MVEAVSHSAGKNRIQRPGAESSPAVSNGRTAGPAGRKDAVALGGASDSISISAAAKALPEELKSGPPVEIETVERIKEAIADNRYPIDLEAITESLFQSFLEVSR